MRVAAAGGTATPAVAMDTGPETFNHFYPWFLPDGRHFLYTSQQAGDIPVRVGSLDETGKPGKTIAQAQSNVGMLRFNMVTNIALAPWRSIPR